MKESKYLKANEENLKKFLSIPVLRDFETKDLEALLKVSKIRQYEPKEMIIEEGESDKRIFFLISGEVRVFKNNQEIAILKRMGDMFGEMGLIKGTDRTASIYAAVSNTICLMIETDYINRLSGTDKITFCYILYRGIAGILADRLKEADERYAQAKSEVKKLKGIIQTAQAK